MHDAEIQHKEQRLGEFLDRHRLDGVLLQHRNNFSWITCGGDNHIANNSPVGVAAILATRNQRICLANSIESPRMQTEELAGRGIEIVSFPWWDRSTSQKAVREILAGRNIAADTDEFGLGLSELPGDFAELRWSLTDAEIARYREGARRTTAAMEQTCRELLHGATEHEIAGLLDLNVHTHGCNPIVTLIAADDRIEKYRHPIPTARKAEHRVMLVTCAEYAGLISCLTRFVSFRSLSEELKRRHRAVCNVDAAMNLSTRPGTTLGDLFAILQRAYAAEGFTDEWKLHHQGGSTGYSGREVFATPDSGIQILANQAFAWNPSITGAKSEDTVLCAAAGIEVLTQSSNAWPMLEARFEGQPFMRPDILVRE